MPTIEIVSVNSIELGLNQDDFEVSIIEGTKIESHRGLFDNFLLKHQGIIIRIGNPDFKTNKDIGYFAGGIINWDFDDPGYEKKRGRLKSNDDNRYANQDFNFQFRQEYIDDINRILHVAIDRSPISKIFFLTDYQFGPEMADFSKIEGLASLWKKHDGNGLSWNTMYEINKE